MSNRYCRGDVLSSPRLGCLTSIDGYFGYCSGDGLARNLGFQSFGLGCRTGIARYFKNCSSDELARHPGFQNPGLGCLTSIDEVRPEKVPERLRYGRHLPTARPDWDKRVFLHLDDAANRTCHSRSFQKSAERKGMRIGESRGQVRTICGVRQTPKTSIQTTGMQRIQHGIETSDHAGRF